MPAGQAFVPTVTTADWTYIPSEVGRYIPRDSSAAPPAKQENPLGRMMKDYWEGRDDLNELRAAISLLTLKVAELAVQVGGLAASLDTKPKVKVKPKRKAK